MRSFLLVLALAGCFRNARPTHDGPYRFWIQTDGSRPALKTATLLRLEQLARQRHALDTGAHEIFSFMSEEEAPALSDAAPCDVPCRKEALRKVAADAGLRIVSGTEK